jgi:hypothetical protein
VLVSSGLLAVTTGAQTPTPQTPTPQTGTRLAEATVAGRKIPVAICRDSQKERVEKSPEGVPGTLATI